VGVRTPHLWSAAGCFAPLGLTTLGVCIAEVPVFVLYRAFLVVLRIVFANQTSEQFYLHTCITIEHITMSYFLGIIVG